MHTWYTDFRQDIARINVPTLVMHGEADRIVPRSAAGARTAKLIKGARVVPVKDGELAGPEARAGLVRHDELLRRSDPASWVPDAALRLTSR